MVQYLGKCLLAEGFLVVQYLGKCLLAEGFLVVQYLGKCLLAERFLVVLVIHLNVKLLVHRVADPLQRDTWHFVSKESPFRPTLG